MQVSEEMVRAAMRAYFQHQGNGLAQDAMRAALEAALAAMWRTVEEYTGHFTALVWSDDGGRIVAFKDIAGQWYSQPGCVPIEHHLPTHFMPLPQPPTS